ncbi:RED-like protein N-terminal region-domain-containing protein [Fomitopsis serialis]|uniref:RED-like protein N-terminal region-domain-containing protein n=1 Tax=Fomitopsis serialis TaxID=139415 RepID=UPI002008BCFE|nr:RED-like protein N-terminal region-domain-containing protein [Neoantrodia serialis]KAH9933397.1 RED-like protein N-terminal region-domain-containing protein [Neoantrodia serialis]
MDQESFRKLLQTSKASGTPTSRGSLLASTSKSKSKTVDSSQPAFKPRTVKKKSQTDQAYRDRAAERRKGLDNDYAQVEALAEDFEKRTADNADRAAVEEQRRYLGGDSDHTVLVKGLDLALLEQNRARLAASTAAEDDASLELAFREVASTAPRKRTREEIVQELKAKRAKTSGEEKPTAVDPALEEAKKAGKFRPIGFKPIGGGTDEKPKKRKKVKAKTGGQEGELSQKKVKSDAGVEKPPSEPVTAPEAGPSTVAEAPAPPPKAKPILEPEPVDVDVDIFADAGDYTGVDLGDDDESENEHAGREREEGEEEEAPPPPRRRWVALDDEQPEERAGSPGVELTEASPPVETQRTPVAAAVPSDHEEEEEERPVRLQPLASSAIPSIRELLEMDASSGKGKRGGKKGKKKDKNGGGEGGVDKNKIDRDYQRLKAYTDKKGAGSGS